jgi:hypothetical protein
MIANYVAFRFGVNAESTGATAQRADCPPFFVFNNEFFNA